MPVSVWPSKSVRPTTSKPRFVSKSMFDCVPVSR
jgi:hypothetical protein